MCHSEPVKFFLNLLNQLFHYSNLPKSETGDVKMKYRVHRFSISMTRDQHKLEQFLNNLEGEVVAIIPNVTWAPKTQVDFLLIVEKLG